MLLGTTIFALLAGVLSTLSPCVLPLLPVILVAATSEHRLGPVALASGLALSFVVIGLFVATIGYGIGLDASIFRIIAAMILIGIGVILLVPQLQTQVAAAAAPISGWAEERFGGIETGGLSGQFSLGLLLGAVWSPCVGPDARRRLRACRAGREPGAGRIRHAGVRRRRRVAAAAARALVARDVDALARTALGRWKDGQSRARRPAASSSDC